MAAQGRQRLIERARAIVTRLSAGQASEWQCVECGGLGDESRHRCESCRAGWYRHRPCLVCNGFGIYWGIAGTAVTYSVAGALRRPDLEGGALHDH